MLVVNGLTLPASFERFLSRPDAAPADAWLPKENLDAYGNEWRTFPLELFTAPQILSGWTPGLPGAPWLASETAEQVAERNADAAEKPGSIPWITDFSRIVQFGRNDTGEAYCFDFRDDPHNPSIIFNDGWYWRRVAPDFDTLLGILELYDGIQDLDDRDEEIQRKRNPNYDPDEGQPLPPVPSPQSSAEPSTLSVQPAVLPRAPVRRPSAGPGTLIVNEVHLPATFEAFIEKYPARVWDLKETVDADGLPLVDAYGRPIKVQFRPYDTLELIKKVTAKMGRDFVRMVDLSQVDPERREMIRVDLEAVRPGYLPTITDYAQIVQFGRSPFGPAFCFDFRENIEEPSVIHMPMGELRWRWIAPNFETFLCLLDGYEEG